jgi:hypothetical protein
MFSSAVMQFHASCHVIIIAFSFASKAYDSTHLLLEGMADQCSLPTWGSPPLLESRLESHDFY